MDGGSADKFHTLVPGSKSGHWTWATCSLYQKPMSSHRAVCLHIGLFGGWEGLPWFEMATLFPRTLFPELFYLHQDSSAGERVPGPEDGAWVSVPRSFCFLCVLPSESGIGSGTFWEPGPGTLRRLRIRLPRQAVPYWNWIWTILLAFQDHHN